ncbi:hypothetical protein [Rugamonas rubra]|uniref:Uncharacterized protein n=1 Tax=Rugamonas rubra TaxID=758825 RepID=A0A1I4M469_9BURK|nr:hypothetical protein [Rugamonas rubra]SFL98158.1 hypothetical protein SAMN02982985_02239 [Rugamonas rubra]
MFNAISTSAAMLGKLATALPALAPKAEAAAALVSTGTASHQLLAATGGGAKLRRQLEQKLSAQGLAGKIGGALPLAAEGLKLLGATLASLLGEQFGRHLAKDERGAAAGHAARLRAGDAGKESLTQTKLFLEGLLERVEAEIAGVPSQAAGAPAEGAKAAQDIDGLKEFFELVKKGREAAMSLI